MKFVIKHEIRGRLHVHLIQKRMTFEEADTLQYYLSTNKYITSVKVYQRTCDVAVTYVGDRAEIIKAFQRFAYSKVDVPDVFIQNSGRELNQEYWDKLVNKVVLRCGSKLFLPYPVRAVAATIKSVRYIWEGIKCLAHGKIEVPVLDGTAIGVSIFRGDFDTAGSVMFLLGIGEILEEWTHKKSVGDLARSMSLNIGKVWLVSDGQEVLVPAENIQAGDKVVVHMGNVIPFDGIVSSGEAMVNQASLTGESLPVRKAEQASVYAGTVVEEGGLTIQVKQVNGSTYLFTRNVTKALSVLMVDFSCALKLAMPISVLSAIREASVYDITVKGGKYLEAMAEADTIVFDKTGTLTKAQPTVVDVVSFNGKTPDELLRIAACLEEHFPHSMAKAVVDAARKKNLVHEEMHSKVQYIVAHGISTTINDKKAVIGSYHFVFEDEKCIIPAGMEQRFEELPSEYSHLYLAIEGVLEAVICIEDPLREEAAAVVNSLKCAGISKVVMMTGDSERTASAIAKRVGVDEYYSEVLPEDKASFIEKEKKAGRKVVMIGDGINDSPALSAADVGIAISDGAELAREIADVTVGADNLYEIVTLKAISNGLMKRIHKNYRTIVGFNSGLIVLGVAGVLAPTTSAMLHNTSTLLISLKSMENVLS